ncbi:50S ribosomal protein L5 [Clostridium sp. 'deep sea']|uniref:50S ribosomal protein L5 n=1 Tax=Clostridium sp. 'deep sea' TaxID=2779445 RepID=UPI0018969570|nr:50S ribosomal protein L5 [Clostridium sp. 'deep sea']QOR34589.1 50S ribosomal protein L5 [Clostridium sp. 'deep sea']
MSRLKEKYISEVKPAMQEKFNYDNVMEIPKIEKISVNMGVGRAVEDKKLIDYAVADLATITGQKPVVNNARRSVSNFKLRAGMPIGCKVTLRGKRMYDFLDKLISINLPRVRDFRGISPEAFDGRGNYTLGVKEQLIFPEIRYDQVQHVQGMNITIVTTAKSDEEAHELLTLMGMPFKR